MYPDTPSVGQLSHVIAQAAAPAFLLGALAAFIALLINRLNRVVDRTVVLNGIPDDDAVRSRLKADLPRLMRCAAMINRAIFWAVVASISATLLVIVAFVTAFLQIQHERGVAIFFLISLGAFTVALVDFAREVRIALSGPAFSTINKSVSIWAAPRECAVMSSLTLASTPVGAMITARRSPSACYFLRAISGSCSSRWA
jgi:hypothetical protein